MVTGKLKRSSERGSASGNNSTELLPSPGTKQRRSNLSKPGQQKFVYGFFEKLARKSEDNNRGKTLMLSLSLAEKGSQDPISPNDLL